MEKLLGKIIAEMDTCCTTEIVIIVFRGLFALGNTEGWLIPIEKPMYLRLIRWDLLFQVGP